MRVLKCIECGNTFQRDRIAEGEVLSCPVCETNYRATTKDGKIRLQDFDLEEKDFGEL